VSSRQADLPRRLDAASQARQLLTVWFGDALEQNLLDAAKLISSELINNAVLHGRGAIRLLADVNDDRVLIEVVDEGEGFEHVVREVPFDQLSGRGLAIVEAASSRWGIHEGTTHVWAEMERTGPRLGRDAKPAS
jgi:anti-sigma regulatory factor (Ser/Thr protein kinase)